MSTKLLALQEQLESLIDQARDLIEDNLPEKGDTSETSQKVYLRLELSKFSNAVDSILPFDLIPVDRSDALGLETAEDTYNADPTLRVYRFTMMAESQNYECIGCAPDEESLMDVARSIASESDLENDDLLIRNVVEINQ